MGVNRVSAGSMGRGRHCGRGAQELLFNLKTRLKFEISRDRQCQRRTNR